ncbi:MAG: DUF523 domain-containing protein [Gammaproteobacteria bacterium]|jgi:uncharacterized protein YbbK (DUF523 family)
MFPDGPQRIHVGVSSCLLGNNVRYDGQNRQHDHVMALCENFTCIAICPEYAIGLGIPRAPINIIKVTDNHYRVKGSANPHLDVTEELVDYADHIHQSMPEICGYIFKSRSPSCGVASTPYFDPDGNQLGVMDGIYSGRIKQLAPTLPIVEEVQLTDKENQKAFEDAVRQYAVSHGMIS